MPSFFKTSATLLLTSFLLISTSTIVNGYPAQNRINHRRLTNQVRNLITTAANSTIITNADGSTLTSSGLISCTSTYTVLLNDVCASIGSKLNVTIANLKALNPTINSDCKNLEVGAVLCTSNATSSVSALIKPSNVTSVNSTIKGVLGSVSVDGWNLTKLHTGATFFDDFAFYGDLDPRSNNDPTHGSITYVGKTDAWDQKLVSADASGVIMKIDSSANNWNRNSIRVHSTDQYNIGTLLIMDAAHIPTAQSGIWPAFWTVGPNWPNSGEIDILEYVNDDQKSQTSFHTGDGCYMGETGMNSTSSIVGGTNCNSYATANGGCGVKTEALAGEAFNAAGGGVYAMQWTKNGIYTWFWARNDIPADITANSPVPTTWGLPIAFVAPDTCNPATAFKDHSIVINLATCGDWAGGAFVGGISACQSYMANADLSGAYWNISSIAVFQSN